MAAFQRAQDEVLAEQIIDILRAENYELADTPATLLRTRVAKALARGRGYGIQADTAIQSFVALTFQFGPHFDRHHVVARILNDRRLPPDGRIYAIIFDLSDRVWEEMAILSAPDNPAAQADGGRRASGA